MQEKTGRQAKVWAMFLVLSLALFPLGCGQVGTGRGEGPPQAEAAAGQERAEHAREANGTWGEEPLLHMCGRSVLAGWFEHWGWDYDQAEPFSFAGYGLLYHEVDVPPGIMASALEVIGEAGAGEALFFKLCFADFAGGDEETARSNLEDNIETIRTVTEAAVAKGLLVILGNALPTVEEYTDPWLTWNHRQYNRFLEELASEYPGRVVVLDLYGTLASPGGALRVEYASNPHDSHLNERAYDALDDILEEALERLSHVD